MKRAVLLIHFLCCWHHVGSYYLKCVTDVVSKNQALSLPSSTEAGAKASVLRKYQAPSLLHCLEECCSQKYGSCSVAEFRNHSKDANCFHYVCEPISGCKFVAETGTDTISFSAFNQNTTRLLNHMIQREERMSFENRSVLTTFKKPYKDGDQLVTIRKSVETQETATKNSKLISWKDVSSTPYNENFYNTSNVIQDLSSELDLSLKNDNTTIKPRKGVEEVKPFSPNIKARKGVEPQAFEVTKPSKSNIKPRKGAVPFSFSVTPASDLNETIVFEPAEELNISTDIKTSLSTQPFNNTLSADLISLLEQVFRDDSVDHSSTESHTFRTSTPVFLTISSTPVASYSEYSTHSPMNSFSSESPITTSMTSHSIQPSTSSYFDKVSDGTPQLTTTIEHDEHTSVPSSHIVSSSYRTPALLTSTDIRPTNIKISTDVGTSADLSMDYSWDSTLHQNDTVLLFTVSSKLSAISSDESENERRYKSSMHLVLSLVFGLVVLFAVLGAVAKRVYDVWMRRHYHRMDFLIDGMYDGYS